MNRKMLFNKKNSIDKEEVSRYAASAKAYISAHFDPPSPPKPVVTDRVDSGIRYSRRDTEIRFRISDDYSAAALDSSLRGSLKRRDISQIRRSLNDNADLTFVEKLIVLIRDKGVRDSQVYKPAGIDRRLFSKIMSDMRYSPSKDTAVAIALALHLTADEAEDLLKRAGFTFSHSSKRDLILEHSFREGFYDIPHINAVLEELGERRLGR